ncbi:MAG: sugar phosphate isomerase/epimerase family protein, partial [Promethearchaeota archaeon]
IASIMQLKRKTGIKTICHLSSIDVNPVAYNPSLQELTLEQMKRSLEFAKSIGSKKVTIHGGYNSFGSSFSNHDVFLFKGLIQSLIQFEHDMNLKIKPCIENDAATKSCKRPLESLEVLEEILDDYKELGLVLDVAHVIKSSRLKPSLLTSTTRLDLDNILDFIEKYKNRIEVLHLSCPNEFTTHGRLDFSSGNELLQILKILSPIIIKNDADVILEYSLSMFRGLDDAITCVVKDINFLNQFINNPVRE